MQFLRYFFFFLMSWSPVLAQETDALPEVNDSLYNSLESVGMLYGGDLAFGVQKTVSLKQYWPQNKWSGSGGLTWAAAICKTMAVQVGIASGYSPAQIEKEVFSPFFLFALLPKATNANCSLRNDWITETGRIVTNVGQVRLDEYPSMGAGCKNVPSAAVIRKAGDYKAKSFLRLFLTDAGDHSASIGSKQFAIKRSLNRKHPVVLCLYVDPGFQKLRSETWEPIHSSLKPVLQTVVVVGFDEQRQAFEVSGASGSWGKGGFAWIRYQDLKYVRYGFEILMEARPVSKATSRPVAAYKKSVQKQRGKVVENDTERILSRQELPELNATLVLTTVGESDDFVKLTPSYHAQGYYQLSRRFGELSQFQLNGTRATPGSYVYVLSVDPKGKAALHYPYTKAYGMSVVEKISPVIPDYDYQIVIPEPIVTYDESGKQSRKEQVMIKEYNGTEWLIVLYSRIRLDSQLPGMLQSLSGVRGNLPTHFRMVFAPYLMAREKIRYASDELRFSTLADQSEGLVPVIIRID